MKKTVFSMLILLLCSPVWGARKVYMAKEHGIVADGKTLNTNAIQKAIDELSNKGGGILKFTEGEYLTGSLVLKSNVTLDLDRDAVIRGSSNPNDYKSLIKHEAGDNSTLALIVANKVANVGITGAGLIDGNGRDLALAINNTLNLPDASGKIPERRRRANEPLRPKLFFFSNCSGIKIDGLRLLNSACWGMSFHSCRNLTIRKVDFTNRAYWNNDGMDITDCKQVHVSGCNINSADDGICLKSYDTTSCNDSILIEDCDIASSASAVKFGTASWGGFRHITVRNIRVKDTFRSAIALECVDGGTLQDVLVENIKAVNTGNPIFIRLGHRNGNAPGKVKNITIRNVFAEMPFDIPDINYDVRGPGFSVNNPRPSSITGIPGHEVEDVTLENVEIVYPGRSSTGIAYYPLSHISQVPEQIKSYPEFSMFGELPAWGFYMRHVKGVTMKNVRLSLKDEDFRPAFVLDDAHNITFKEISLPIFQKHKELYSVNSSFIENCLEGK